MRRLAEQVEAALSAEDLTVSELAARWLDQYVRAAPLCPKRREHLERYAERIVMAIGDVPASSVGHKEVAAVRRSATAKWAQWGTLGALKQLLTWGRTEALVYGPDRVGKIKIPRSAKREVILEPEEWLAVYAALTSMPVRCGRQTLDLLRMMLLTGARPGELAALEWESVSLRWRNMQIVDGKTGDRLVELPAEAIAVLKEQVTRSGLVFPSPRSKAQIQSSSWGEAWRRALRLAKVRRCPPYTARHTYVTNCLEKGFSAHEIAEHVGNSGRVIMDYYAHARRSRLRHLAEAALPEG